ncbi:Dimodular nonribosomal peptide synthase [Actinomadura rubteroloni]|uniref:Dimodular nonribosomal peptide synthase n=1 Tax=Actinomadura rubteroloni TaxID=1926885 RepID=A0A2P4UHK1_9ACTN|nr:non-ribosomal peptide synthetase [Actinomadura rubteroloni]POM24529.1 Dimodular nonribosomal peptide synthase [Actinomadura rubteroloni]
MTSPASVKEEALWLLDRMVPDGVPNNLAFAFRTDGRLSLRAVRGALTALVRRHESLRTVFRAEGAALTRTVLPAASVDLGVTRVPSTGEAPEDELAPFVAEPFAFTGEPLIRVAVLDGEPGDTLCFVVHHLVFDATSIPVFVEEFASAYGGLVAEGLVPADLTAVVPALTDPPARPESEAYWRELLDGHVARPAELACGRPDGPAPNLAGDHLLRNLPESAVAAVRRVQRTVRAPETVVLLAAYLLLLDAHGAGPELVVGVPAGTRPRTDPRAIGYHVNVLPLRTTIDPAESVRDFVRRTRDAYFDALTHADVPVDGLTRTVRRSGDSWRNMLFQHAFNYVEGPAIPPFVLGGVKAEPLHLENGSAKFDLELFVMSAADGVRIRAVYRTELFDPDDVALMIERYERLLHTLDADPDAPVGSLRVWSERDEAVIGAANATSADAAPGVLREIHARAVADPDAPAVLDGDRAVTRAGLWAGALAVRDALPGVGPGDIVAVAAPRGPELAAAVLGVWLTGAAYLPVDPDHPAPRVAYQLEDSGAGTLLWSGRLPSAAAPVVVEIPAVPATAAAPDAAVPDDDQGALAYLMYTSGSTGRPKGTLVGRGALANLVAHFAAELGAGDDHATVWLTTFAFDISGLELFVPLASGGRVVVAPDEARVNGRLLAEVIERHGADAVQATPTTWRAVLAEAGPALGGRQVLSGGEPLPPESARALLATGCELHHVYGPTETTIWSTSAVVPGPVEGRLDVGRPIRDTRVHILDADGRELPIGVRGELCIAGGGLARGYHGRPELTAERFPDAPGIGRHYRTGDTAYWRADGTLVLLGRSDRQIKLRGNRIELGEIEAALAGHPDLRSAAVVLDGDPSGDGRLVAFVTAAATAPSPEELWGWAGDRLPRAMVPAEFAVLDALPTTANDKVDYPALTRLAARRTAAAPSGGAETTDDELVGALLGFWRDLLELPDPDPHTNFFLSGGNSLQGALLGQRVEELTGVVVPLAEVFEHPTPLALAARIRGGSNA